MENQRLRVVAWNCAGGFHRKVTALTAIGADIAILSEVPNNCAALVKGDASGAWIGTNPDYGLAVVGMNGWQIERIDPIIEERLFLPVRAVRGSEERHLIGVCVKKDENYVAPTLGAMSKLSSFISKNAAILAGDFNQLVSFDARRQPDAKFARVLDVLDRLGLVSAWHGHHGERFGAENASTYFHQWKRVQGFHIDYVFVPNSIAVSSAVLGSYDEFVTTRLSDHVPLTVDLC
ncbi:MAG: hypothetical protein E5X51_31870 [Mesorhizobium sp.]|uniref:endonuclease/exonuclease/phosphatase family protein n=1 Tax=Mesorhizobium sp. TaxID=1871066 RepID=UPI0012239489|nr:endonuclease/exonuclease/phosphatase family protein [Mesorhizobium sp.]TIQ17126.1 MAG: hypothetical protein E5X51_31870 [Mesorhizobium sp.]